MGEGGGRGGRLFWGFKFFEGGGVGGFFGECKMCFFGCKKILILRSGNG
jgi:hypothetical protein